MSNIKPFIDQYDWKEKNFSSDKKDWNNFGKIAKQLHLISYMYLAILKK